MDAAVALRVVVIQIACLYLALSLHPILPSSPSCLSAVLWHPKNTSLNSICNVPIESSFHNFNNVSYHKTKCFPSPSCPVRPAKWFARIVPIDWNNQGQSYLGNKTFFVLPQRWTRPKQSYFFNYDKATNTTYQSWTKRTLSPLPGRWRQWFSFPCLYGLKTKQRTIQGRLLKNLSQTSQVLYTESASIFPPLQD